MQFTFHHDILAKEDKPKSYLIPFWPTYTFPYLTIFLVSSWKPERVKHNYHFPNIWSRMGPPPVPTCIAAFSPGSLCPITYQGSECTLLCKFIAIQVITLQCILSTGQCTVYTVHSTMHNVHCTLYNVHFTMYNVQYTLYSA